MQKKTLAIDLDEKGMSKEVLKIKAVVVANANDMFIDEVGKMLKECQEKDEKTQLEEIQKEQIKVKSLIMMLMKYKLCYQVLNCKKLEKIYIKLKSNLMNQKRNAKRNLALIEQQ